MEVKGKKMQKRHNTLEPSAGRERPCANQKGEGSVAIQKIQVVNAEHLNVDMYSKNWRTGRGYMGVHAIF